MKKKHELNEFKEGKIEKLISNLISPLFRPTLVEKKPPED